ncbi:MAG: hypothetical protein A2213_05525 [Lysobacterales bacterium RIFOXYA1_FULL_68_6]|jgi:hypothetical protein|nr:hypothetical protein [uncultured Pseudoxanthomonas sp.]OHE89831.1 MAG: hypothetical protein A2213_05525 [Xanthomonadales bacterium RIFOXYA1_FULL_68_6]
MHEDHNATTGLVIHAFVNHAEQRIVIAVRGGDDPLDGKGPNIAVARDGELLDLMGAPAPATDRTRAQMARLQETVLPGDAWDTQFRQALDFAKGAHSLQSRRWQAMQFRSRQTHQESRRPTMRCRREPGARPWIGCCKPGRGGMPTHAVPRWTACVPRRKPGLG